MVEEKENNSLNWIVYVYPLVILAIIFVLYLLFACGEYGHDILGQTFSFGKPEYHISNAFDIVK
tara:strand:- start:29716 stop:29907 length:192 start_codon:yes stop_codon:yes gene_type:complete